MPSLARVTYILRESRKQAAEVAVTARSCLAQREVSFPIERIVPDGVADNVLVDRLEVIVKARSRRRQITFPGSLNQGLTLEPLLSIREKRNSRNVGKRPRRLRATFRESDLSGLGGCILIWANLAHAREKLLCTMFLSYRSFSRHQQGTPVTR